MTYTVAGGFTIFDTRLKPHFVAQKGSESSIAGLPLELMQQLIAHVTA